MGGAVVLVVLGVEGMVGDVVGSVAAACEGWVAGVVQGLVAGGLRVGCPEVMEVVVGSGLSLLVVGVVVCRGFCCWRFER